MFPSWLGWAGRVPASPICFPLQPAEATVPGGSSGEGGASLLSLFFLIIFARFPAPSPKPLSHSFQEAAVTQGGAAAPLCPRGELCGTCAQLSPRTQNGEEKGETEDGNPPPWEPWEGRHCRAWVGRGLILAPTSGPRGKCHPQRFVGTGSAAQGPREMVAGTPSTLCTARKVSQWFPLPYSNLTEGALLSVLPGH